MCTLVSFTFLAHGLSQEALLIPIYCTKTSVCQVWITQSQQQFHGTYRTAQTPAVLLVNLQLPMQVLLNAMQMVCIRSQFCSC